MIPVAVLWFAAAGPTQPVPANLLDVERINLERNLRWILERERRTLPRAKVGVYADAGVWHPGARSIVEALEGVGVPCRVLDRTQLRVDVLRELDALILPGGFAPTQWASAGSFGLAGIAAFVEGGGRCIGVCAGAYLLSRGVKYDGITYAYPVGLFDGVAEGPVQGLAAFPTPGRATLGARGDALQRLAEGDCYYSGGPCFRGGTRATTLATYADGSAAAVQRKVGKGDVILLGVHPERPVGGDEDAPPPKRAGEVFRALLLR